MSKALKLILFPVFVAVMLALSMWSYFIMRDHKTPEAEIQQEYAEQEKECDKDRPLPEAIYILPIEENIPGIRTYWGLSKENIKSREANALRINKREGVYYWDSNEGKPLAVDTIIRVPENAPSFPRKVSIFTALDGSGSIIITHDHHPFIGNCNSTPQYSASYVEYRLNEGRELKGCLKFFPPRPDDWCKPTD